MRPAFEGTPKQIPREVAALCEALHQLPAERRAACCQTSAAVHFGSECARVLSLAVEQGTVELKGSQACVKDLVAAHQGCGWVGPNDAPLPQSCAAVVSGKLKPGWKCRSELECKAGLRCMGAGPTATGMCAPPGLEGSACEMSVDVLISYLRASPRPHVECIGFCQRHRCESPLQGGMPCTLDAQCVDGTRCAGLCTLGGPGAVGEGCVPGGCVAGLRCIAGNCAALKAEGEACAEDIECLGGCVGEADGGPKKCGPKC